MEVVQSKTFNTAVGEFKEDRIKWLRKQLNAIENEFQGDYNLDNILLGLNVTLGIPSSVMGSVTVTVSSKKPKKSKGT